jgi:hypothetical protein
MHQSNRVKNHCLEWKSNSIVVKQYYSPASNATYVSREKYLMDFACLEHFEATYENNEEHIFPPPCTR